MHAANTYELFEGCIGLKLFSAKKTIRKAPSRAPKSYDTINERPLAIGIRYLLLLSISIIVIAGLY